VIEISSDTETERAVRALRSRFGSTPCHRELDAADVKKKMRAEFERYLGEQWDEAREAWLESEAGK
jgi:hypothetical protein